MTMRLSRWLPHGRILASKTIAVAASLALASGLVVGSTAGPAQAKAAPVIRDLVSTDAAATPKLDWRDCKSGWGATIKCATAQVPLNWRQPRGKTISLALVKVPASKPEKRIGSLFFNPGGPGGPAVPLIQNFPTIFPPEVYERFDVVGFDPRFVGQSSAALCVSDKEFLPLQDALSTFPVTRSEQASFLKAVAAYTKACAANAPQLRYASTASVARDLDLLRKAVGDKQLNFVGYSYGTYLGQTYAQLFPTKVRAMVLDGVLDAKAWATGYGREAMIFPHSSRVGSDMASTRALHEFLRLCAAVGPNKCKAAAYGNPRTVFGAVVATLRAKPLTVNNQKFTYPTFISYVSDELGSARTFGELGNTLAALYQESKKSNAGTAASLVVPPAHSLRPQPLARTSMGLAASLSYQSDPRLAALKNFYEVLMAVGCSDALNPPTPAMWPVAAAIRNRIFPHFGAKMAWESTVCGTWRLSDPNVYRGPFGGSTANPILVMNTTFDSATPVEGAIITAKRFANSRLLVVNGYGHTTNRLPSACAQRARVNYLIAGKLPAPGTVCRQDVAPFDYRR